MIADISTAAQDIVIIIAPIIIRAVPDGQLVGHSRADIRIITEGELPGL
ncbi:hypothetical protein [Neomoorella thermoacetica]|nr:hypothetical protein [Moorella thermoacetica]